MNERHHSTRLGEAVSRFQTEQSATDHDDALLLRRQRQQQVDVPAVAEGMHARQIDAGHAKPQRRRAGGQHELGKTDALLARDLELAAADVDLGGDAAVFQGDAAVAPPLGRPQLDVVRGGLAGENRRQQHAIIRKPRLLADHGDGVTSERHLRQFVDSRAAAIPLPTITSGSLTACPYSAAWGRP